MVQRVTFTAKEAAEYLGISYWLLLELVKRKQINPIKAGNRYLFRQSALDDWMTRQEAGEVIVGCPQQETLKLVRAR